jgi:sugar phosphate isomerase/epimerase
MIAEGLVEAADEARAAGLVLAFEDFNPSPDLICSGAQCREILDLSRGVVKFVFDTGNFIAAGERADEVFDLLADDICHCHFKDFVSDPAESSGYRSVDVGTGEVPNADIAARLLARGFDQWIALETRPRDDVDPVTAIGSEWPLFTSWFKQ